MGINKLKMHFFVNYLSLENSDFSSSSLATESEPALLKSAIFFSYFC